MPTLSTPWHQAPARNRTSGRTPARPVSRFALESKPSAQARTRGAPTVRRPDRTAPVSSLPPAAAARNRDCSYSFDSLIQHRNQNTLAGWNASHNATAQARRADGNRLSTATRTRRCLQPCWLVEHSHSSRKQPMIKMSSSAPSRNRAHRFRPSITNPSRS